MEYTSFTLDSTIDGPNDSRYLELLKEPEFWQRAGFFNAHKEYSWLGSNLRYGEPKNQFIKTVIIDISFTPIDNTLNFGMWAPVGPAKHLGWKISGVGPSFERWDGDFDLKRTWSSYPIYRIQN